MVTIVVNYYILVQKIVILIRLLKIVFVEKVLVEITVAYVCRFVKKIIEKFLLKESNR
jgi:hypothetical protein